MAEILGRKEERERDSSDDLDDEEVYQEEGRQEYEAAVQAGLIPDKQGGAAEPEGGWKSAVRPSDDIIRRGKEARAKAAAGWKHGDPWPLETAGAERGGASPDAANPGASEAEGETHDAAPDRGTESGEGAAGEVSALAGQEMPAEADAGQAGETKPQTEGAGKETGETALAPGTENGQRAAVDVPALAGQEMSSDVGAGPANGTEAAGGIPDFGDYPMPDRTGKPDIERDRVLNEMKKAAGEQVNRVCKAAATSIDMVELAVEKAIKQIEQKVPSMDSREIADLVLSVRQFEEHFRAVKADETRRREVSAARRRYRWPLRGLVAAGVVALLLAGAAGQARWGLIDGYGLVDAASNGWRQVVWNAHGWKIANCMKTAHDRNPKAVCSVTARVK